jgi:response regulator RpfG family c-di-GMP phosphodiesterase
VLGQIGRTVKHRDPRYAPEAEARDLSHGESLCSRNGPSIDKPMVRILAGRVKILAVDDKPANLLALEAVLDDQLYSVLTALSGWSALEVLIKNPDIALILLDVQMPTMDGFEVARRIKKMPGFEEIPVIFITAICTEDPSVRQGYQVGAVDYFSKPFDPDVLRRKVKVYASFQHKVHLLQEKERQLAETEELLHVARKHAAVLETLNVGVMISDLDGRISQTNEMVLKILKSVDQAKDDSYGEFLEWWDHDGQLLKNHDGPLLRALKKGEISHHEVVEILCFDRTPKSISTSASPLRGRKGEIVGAVVVIRDITAHRKSDEEIQERIVHLVSGTAVP